MSSPYDRPAGGRWRYVHPPTWPAPPAGWTPWVGWQPPVEWAQAPAGWVFWARDRPWPARHPKWTAAAAVFAVLFVVAGVTGEQPAPDGGRLAAAADQGPAPVTTMATPSPSASPTPSPTPSPSPSATPSPSAAPVTTKAAPVTPVVPAAPYYASCAAVVAAGKAPLRQGQPGYRAGLDGDSDGIACEATAAPAPRTTRAPAPPPPAPVPPPAAVYYANCTAARAAGAAPLHRGDPGYRSGLDRDGDGVACE